MKGRYEIIEDYFGLFDDKSILCVTDSLMHAVHLCELLEKACEDRGTYSYYFKKIVNDVDEVLDYYPGESFFDVGEVLDCKNLAEFKRKCKTYKKEG